MRKKTILFILIITFTVLYVIYTNLSKQDTEIKVLNLKSNDDLKDLNTIITIAVVACGQRLQETLTLLKSALLFNNNGSKLHFVLIAEESLHSGFEEKFVDWQELLPNSFSYKILNLQFPKLNSKEWKNLFKPCAAQRLFLPSLLKDIDSILYLDTDTVFLSPINEIWKFFKLFNSTQIAGLANEHEDKNVGWYNRFARHPFYGPQGVNSGVMLMNLTRMRQFDFEAHIVPIYKQYKMKITWGDQDLINVLFYYHPDKLYVFPCQYNYRPDHCIYTSVCNITENGIHIMHGSRGSFHSEKKTIFSTVYNILESYQLDKEPYRNFLLDLDSELEDEFVVNSNCGKVRKEVILNAKKIFLEKDYLL